MPPEAVAVQVIFCPTAALGLSAEMLFTFRSAANVPVAMAKVAAYYAVFTPLSSWLEHVYTMQWGWNEYLATFTNMVLNLVTEFLYQRYFVFGKSIDTQAKKTEEEKTQD